MKATRTILLVTAVLALIVTAVYIMAGGKAINAERGYYSVQERRLPCGRIMRREVEHANAAWRKTMTLMDPEGNVLVTKTRTVEPEHCAAIGAGKFVPGLWRDCSVPL